MLTLIKLYGLVEVVTGTIKILFLAVIIGAMIAINLGGEFHGAAFLSNQMIIVISGSKAYKAPGYPMYVNASPGRCVRALSLIDWDSPTDFDSGAAKSWGVALL